MATKLIPEVITNRERCDEVIQDIISSGQHVAVDAEGVNLGKTGPLTLLQVGTGNGVVYLFDITTNKSLLTSGSLKELLESEKNVKIMHSCRGDSAALYYQFNITLKNVFDTQVAHLVIREADGSRSRLAEKLAVLCVIYGEHCSIYAGKEDVKKQWAMTAGYWAQRPLSQEMIDYATGDVLVLFSIHKRQTGIIQERSLQEKFQEMVTEEILADIKADVHELRQRRLKESVMTIAMEINEKCKTGACRRLSDLGEDELWALDMCRTETVSKFCPIFLNLRRDKFIQFICEIEDRIKTDPFSYEIPNYLHGKLSSNEHFYRGTEAESKAKSLKALLQKVQGENIQRKFKPDTPLEYMKDSEKNYIRYIRLENEASLITIALYERIVYNDLEEIRQNLEQNPYNFKIAEAQYNKIRFLAGKVRCAARLKALAKRLLAQLERKKEAIVPRSSPKKP